MKLVLKVGLAWPELANHYRVGYRGQTVGKVWLATDRRADAMPWEWQLCMPMALPDGTTGCARGKGAALQALANALYGLVLRTPPERLERAFSLSAELGLAHETGEEIAFAVEDPAARPAARTAPAGPARTGASGAGSPATARGTAPRPPSAPATLRQPPRPGPAVAGKVAPRLKLKVAANPSGKAGVRPSTPSPAGAGTGAPPAPARLPPAPDLQRP